MIYAGYTLKKSSDEQYTPAYAVAPIIKYTLIPQHYYKIFFLST